MAIYPHRMRLRGPWECRAIEGGASVRVTMPCAWNDAALASLAGPVRFLRKFGYPGRIDAHERVWLIAEQLSGPAELHVNGASLGHTEPGDIALDMTQWLTPRNRLEIVTARTSAVGMPWDDVGLEIRCTAYLDGMQVVAQADGSLEVTGLVVGACDGPLEIYGMTDGAQAHYQTIVATTSGTPFRFTFAARPAPVRQVRVDLVNVSAVWYAWSHDAGEPAT